MKYFDNINNRLVHTNKNTSPEYWDVQWNKENFKKTILNGTKNILIKRTTKKYINPSKLKRILEGGCGNGQFVYAFDKLGYDSYGVDYAEKTILKTKKIFPNLKVFNGDVRKLDFPSNYFDGYWSIGVIEHFYNGYDSIIKEAERVIKPEGFLFITFPHLSLLRKIKIKLGNYPIFNSKLLEKEEFYQFILNDKDVRKKIENYGFSLVKKIRFSGFKGLKDEISCLNPLLQKIYDSKNKILLIINYGMSLILSGFSNHVILLIFKKKK
jgi:SAM-dependent methyltransferase